MQVKSEEKSLRANYCSLQIPTDNDEKQEKSRALEYATSNNEHLIDSTTGFRENAFTIFKTSQD